MASIWPPLAPRADDSDLYTDNGPSYTGTTTALLVLATVFVALRFWARFEVAAQYGSDDWATVAALGWTYALGAINYAQIAHGMGQHASLLSQDDLVMFFKLLYAFEDVYVTAVATIKIAILLMYLRIFVGRGFKLAAYIIGGIVVAWWISICAVCIFQCTPISKAWLPWSEGTCINIKASFVGNAIPNIITDIAILGLPIGQVWKLQITKAQRISLLFMFLLGGFVMFASIYRFTTIMQFETTDTTFTLGTACTWCVVEVACGVISACLPTLRPLMMKVSGQFPSIQSHNRSRATNGNSRNTELITIGGTGANPKSLKSAHLKSGDRNFQRLDHEFEDEYGSETVIARSDFKKDGENSSSGDEAPLREGIRVTVENDVTWYSGNEKSRRHRPGAGNSSQGSTSPQHSSHNVV